MVSAPERCLLLSVVRCSAPPLKDVVCFVRPVDRPSQTMYPVSGDRLTSNYVGCYRPSDRRLLTP